MDYWVVGSGAVKEGDILCRIVKEKWAVDSEVAGKLSFVDVRQLRAMGLSVRRPTQGGVEKAKRLAHGIKDKANIP